MPVQATDRERIHASILRSCMQICELHCHLHEGLCDLRETVLRSREVISQSLDVIAKADEALVWRSYADGVPQDGPMAVLELPRTRAA
jgi:hypothetical protein